MRRLIFLLFLLIAGQAWGWTNNALYSEQLGMASTWTATRATIDDNSTTAPDGTNTAEKLVGTAVDGSHTVSQTVIGGDTSWVYSVYLKAAEYIKAILALSDNATGSVNYRFNLSNCTVETSGDVGGLGDWTDNVATIISVGSGWCRASISGTKNAGTSIPITTYLHNGTTSGFTGDGTSGIYIWGAQLENTTLASSYIPTTNATASRSTLDPTFYFATGNGVDDDNLALQQALTFASNSGSTCQIPAGKNFLTKEPLYIWGGSTLQGTGGTITFNDDNYYLLNVGISGTHLPQAAFTGTIDNVSFVMAGGSGGRIIYFWRTNGAHITNNYFNTGNYAYSATSSGNNANILTDGEGYIRNNITISGNTVQANTTNVTGSEGIGIGLFTNVIIDNNTVLGVGDDPIGLHGCDNVAVTNNVITSVDSRVYIGGSQNVEIANNNITRVIAGYDNTWYGGIGLIYAAIESNMDSALDNIYIHHNTMTYPANSTDQGGAIYLYGPRHTRVEYNTVVNNSANATLGVPAGFRLLPQSIDGWTDSGGIDPDNIARVHTLNVQGNTMGGAYPLAMVMTANCVGYPGIVTIDNNIASAYYFYCDNVIFTKTTISDSNTHSYNIVNCSNDIDYYGTQVGLRVTGNATIQNYTVAGCAGGAYRFDESATLTNSIGISSGEDITIASGKTVTGIYNLFDNAAKSGSGTYSDGGSTTKWNSDPKFVGTTDFRLQPSSPAINAGVDVGLTTDYAGNEIWENVDIGAYEYQPLMTDTVTGRVFTWPAVPGAIAYQLQIDIYSDFRNPIVNIVTTENSYNQGGLSPRYKYYWRVRAKRR